MNDAPADARVCSRCFQPKPLADFPHNRLGQHYTICAVCIGQSGLARLFKGPTPVLQPTGEQRRLAFRAGYHSVRVGQTICPWLDCRETDWLAGREQAQADNKKRAIQP